MPMADTDETREALDAVGQPSDPNSHAGRLERWLAEARDALAARDAEVERLRAGDAIRAAEQQRFSDESDDANLRADEAEAREAALRERIDEARRDFQGTASRRKARDEEWEDAQDAADVLAALAAAPSETVIYVSPGVWLNPDGSVMSPIPSNTVSIAAWDALPESDRAFLSASGVGPAALAAAEHVFAASLDAPTLATEAAHAATADAYEAGRKDVVSEIEQAACDIGTALREALDRENAMKIGFLRGLSIIPDEWVSDER